MRFFRIFIFLLVMSCGQNEKETSKLTPAVKSGVMDQPNTEAAKTSYRTYIAECNFYNSSNQKRELIKDFFKDSNYRLKEYKFLPFCVDGEYAELFSALLVKQNETETEKFYDFFDGNGFNRVQYEDLIIIYSTIFFDEISNIIEEKVTDADSLSLKHQQKELLTKYFNRVLNSEKAVEVQNQIRDSIISYFNRN